MDNLIKRLFKKNVRNQVLKSISRFGLAINRLYENRNYDINTNGEKEIIKKLAGFDLQCVFDIGACQGNYVAVVRELLPEARILAFEPLTESYEELQERFTGDEFFAGFNLALSRQEEMLTLHLYDHPEHSSTQLIKGMNKARRGSREVKAISGDDFIKERGVDRIDLLKIDVEGTEMDVLRGFEDTFDKRQVRVCQFEYGYANISSHQLLVDFYEFFEERGYEVGKIYPRHVEFRPYHVKHEDFIGPNFLAVDANEKEIIKKLSG